MKRSLHSNIRFSKSVYFILAFILLANFAIGQKSKLVEGGVINGIPYASTQFENINMTNGNVNLNFPLPSLQGRGEVSHTYQLRYSSKLWKTITNPVYNPFYVPDPTYQNFLAEADDAGWQDFDGYQLQIWNRMSGMDVPQGNHCDSGFVWMTAYRWKVEVAAPDGRKIQFRPIGYSDVPPGQSDNVGYFNVHPSGAVSSVVGPGGACYVVETTPSGARMTYYSSDGSGIRLTFANQEQLGFVWEMSMPDGSRIIQKVGGGQKIIDRNGNYIEGTTITLPDSSQAPGWTDQFGRWIARKKSFQTNEDRYYQLGFNGALLTWKVLWKNVYVRKNYTTTCNTCPSNQRGPVIDAQAEMEFRVVDKIVLPEQLGELEYVFDYHAKNVDNSELSPGWGEIKSITIPTGAKISYGYKLSGLVESDEEDTPLVFDLFLRADQIIERAGTINKKVLNYTELYDGQSEEKAETWTYGIGRSSSTMTAPNGGVTNQYYWDIRDDEVKGGQVYKETKADGTIIERNWGNNVPVGATYGSLNHLNAFVNFEVVTIPDANGNPALSKVTDYHHDLNGNLIYTAEYDWIPANSSAIQRTGGYVTGFSAITPVRSSHSTYANPTPEFGSTASSNNEYYFPSAPAFRNLVATTEVRNGAGDPRSRTEITYDYTSFTTNTIGGNITQSKAWDSFKSGQSRAYSNPLTTTNSILTSAIYNDYGMPIETFDANNVKTVITYGTIVGPTQNYTDLYPTQTIVAYGTPVARTSAATYDFYTGLVTTATDVDNNVSVVTEFDGLGRPIKVRAGANTPLESWTRSEYDDVGLRVIVRTDLETVGDGRKVAIQHYDQLGRLRLSRSLESVVTEDPTNEQHGIKVQTRYETGNPNSYQLTSNPYRANTSGAASGEQTMGWTRSKSWNTGRRQEVETFAGASLPAPWGSNTNSTGAVVTDIDGDRTLITDQTGKQRISRANGLGHLTTVWEVTASDAATEPIGFPNQTFSAGYRTSYTYDVLNNLTSVSQGIQTRIFSYSSLSRLLSASNPESGTIVYAYDHNGNRTQKTDARGVLTEYAYDALNRVTNRNYSTTSGTPPNYQATPNVTYVYDDPLIANSKGKLTKVSSSVSTTEYVGFDILGRVTRSKQTTDGVVYGDDNNPMTYTYNRSGALTEQRYPSGRVVKSSVDSDGSLSHVQSRRNSSDFYRTYASNFNYNAAGAISAMKLGNGRWENTAFNSRLQPVQIGLGAGAISQSLLKLEYSYGTTQNNGNVESQKITVKRTGQADLVFDQTYTYDSLNRITSSEEKTGVTVNWHQTYVFDRYGNRNFNEGLTTTLPKNCGTAPSYVVCSSDVAVVNPSISIANNRLNGTAYDAAGNVILDAEGREFTYDSENKQVDVEMSGNQSIAQYSFDADGNRVKKVVVSGETTIFVYDATGKLIGEYSTMVATPQDAKTQYQTSDHLGTPRINTNAVGSVVSRSDYMPYGETIVGLGGRSSNDRYVADDVRQGFTGYISDDETGLDFAQARMYRKQLGRFTGVDPLMIDDKRLADPQRINQYVYVRNNPNIYKDPGGEDIVLGTTDAKEQALLKEALAVIARTESGRAMLTEMDNSKVIISVVIGRAVDNSSGESNYGKISGKIEGTGIDATGEITLEINPSLIESDTEKNKEREKQNKEIKGINEAAKAMGKPELKERELIPNVPQGKNASERNAEAMGHELSHTKSKINTGKANSEAEATKEGRGLVNDKKRAKGKPEEFVEEIIKRRN